ncbi:2,3-dihydro-2,3-dihydroxybenzoate dehydrogenase [Streptomyces sp. NPDC049040]|uniref:2,3-dihydro-2,3-dihydroxybenzoate dehydrogenase n=1 Tax=Streptomyces sp. NPDC049040 TaxID=3365593 RepID=UPI003723D38C
MEGKVALVTGAAGGIGAAVAGELCRRGVAVAAVDCDADRLSWTVGKLVADGARAEAFSVDVASRAQVEAAVAAVEDRLGPLDFLVNSAGVLRMGEVRDLTDQDWAETFAVNATGVFLMSRAVAARMTGRRSGAIVTVASNAADTARTQMAAYAASKAAATMFTKCLGLEVARYGIRCNLVAPGSTDTPMLVGMGVNGDEEKTSIIDGIPKDYKVGIPLRKLALPSDVADAVVFLLSDHAAHITMHSLTVDGGATLGG